MENPDITLIGTGIMSATLGMILKELNPNCTIKIYEKLDKSAQESSAAWNNAGTGHSAFCELNYTTILENGEIDTSKAIKIAEQFEQTRQFWSYLISKNIISNPSDFIHAVPHLSLVWGDDNVAFLKKRYDAMQKSPLFQSMQFYTEVEKLNEIMPLVMQNRKNDLAVAATLMPFGTDVDFGVLTTKMLDYLDKQPGVSINYNCNVKKLKQNEDGTWRLKIKDLDADLSFKINTKFVFIGAGGGSLLLLEKANIDEASGYGGFPVSGQWLKCTNPEIIAKHSVKVYGKANVGAPPMSVPHLDTRIIDGKKELLFGPFAGFSTKFLKNGSYFDLIKSIEIDNVLPMLAAGFHNVTLTKYLIQQVLQSQEDRIKALQEYFPSAIAKDWELLQAGQRVQVIKKDEKEGGILEFGTEIVTSNDGTVACLLGASPGASTAVSAMITVLKKCFPTEFATEEWQEKIKILIPTFGNSLHENPALLNEMRLKTSEILKL